MTEEPRPGGAFPPNPSPYPEAQPTPPSFSPYPEAQPTPPSAPPPSPEAQQPPPAPPPGGGSYPPPPPPPGGGSYPPPPPSSGGYAPPPPGPAIRTLPTESYAPWLTRALAFVIDYAPYAVVLGIGSLLFFSLTQRSCVTDITQYDVTQVCADQPTVIGQLLQWAANLLGLAYLVWNYGYRQGTTGSSLGKSAMKIKVVSEVTGQPIGFGMSVVRQLAHFVDAIICFIGFLFPLWDSKRQTLADKIMTTVVLPIQEG
ncbi:RDD family protein [Mycobacterium bohemicum]|nr:RDD family protein [Mycobacterium bohemicum]MCV6970808.1 RDD family protein [Mycobacterium bohemicum]